MSLILYCSASKNRVKSTRSRRLRIVRRIEEFIALQYLRRKGGTCCLVKNDNLTQKGYDLACSNKGTRISVKVITGENKVRRTTAIKEDWDELLVIELDKGYCVLQIGQIFWGDFKKAFKSGFLSKIEPVCSRIMLRKDGLFGLYRKVEENKVVIDAPVQSCRSKCFQQLFLTIAP